MIAECDRLDSQIASLQNEVSIAEGETVRLNAELNSMVDTEKVIEYAETKLGMVKAESYQITYINLSQGDEFVVAGDKEVSENGSFKAEIKELFAYIF
jgi:cell division protein FtsB